MKELAQKIKSYQEQIASLNSKCKMLAVKAKHATMLLTVSDIEGQQEMDEERSKKSLVQAVMVRTHVMYFVGCIVALLKQIQKIVVHLLKSVPVSALLLVSLTLVCQMTAGRCHTLLSPVTEESGEEGTSSEVSPSPICRSPSPFIRTEVPVTKVFVVFFYVNVTATLTHT